MTVVTSEVVEAKRAAARLRVKLWYSDNRERARSWHKQNRRNNPEKMMWKEARKRAKWKGLAFTITPDDIRIPAACPVLGIPLSIGDGVCHDGSPTLDRLDNAVGYTAANVIVVSSRANRIKNSANLAELRAILEFYEALT